jgi:hypothetical protein
MSGNITVDARALSGADIPVLEVAVIVGIATSTKRR